MPKSLFGSRQCSLKYPHFPFNANIIALVSMHSVHHAIPSV